jgi:hypothetical protein
VLLDSTTEEGICISLEVIILDRMNSLKEDLATAMAMLGQMEHARIAADPQNQEMLEEISRQIDLLQTNVNLLYQRLRLENEQKS